MQKSSSDTQLRFICAELLQFCTLHGEAGLAPEDLMQSIRSWDDWCQLSNILREVGKEVNPNSSIEF